MGYVFTHIFECLLLAAVLGGVIGWVMRGSGIKQKFADLESEWSRKLGLANDETTAATARVKAAEADVPVWRTKFVTLEGDYGKLKTSFADMSATVAAWDVEKAKWQADLAACAEARGKLEADVKAWTLKATAWDTERTGLTARLTAGTGLEAQVKKLQGEHDHAVNIYKQAISNEEALRLTTDKTIAALQADRTALEAHLKKLQVEHDHAVKVYKLAIENEKSIKTGSGKSTAEHDGIVAKLRTDYNLLESQLHQMQLARDQALGKLNRSAADFAVEHDKELSTITELRNRLVSFESERTNWLSERTGWLAERSDWARKHAVLESRLAAPAEALAAAASSGSSAVAHHPSPTGDIEVIQGIGVHYGERLRAAGIAWVKNLLDEGASAEGRKRIAEQTGLDQPLILKWVNQADLMRVSGVSAHLAELLEASGVDTVKELRHRVPANLHAKLAETKASQASRIAVAVPDAETVARWVEIAKTLTPKLTY